MSEAALAALRRGEAAQARGDLDQALDWMERALRLAPGDAHVMLPLAGLRLQGRDAGGAADLFDEVAETHDVREAWIGLATSRLLLGQAAAAAAALAAVFSRHAGIAPHEVQVADMVARASGAPGWCAADGAGRLYLGGLAAGRTVSVTLDGRMVALPRRGARMRVRLPEDWERARVVWAGVDGAALLGAPIALDMQRRVEGFVESAAGGLRGWLWCPGDPAHRPSVLVRAQDGAERRLPAREADPDVQHRRPLARPRGFVVPARALRGLAGTLHVIGRDGRELIGSPLDPSGRIAWVASAGPPPRRAPPPRAVDIVVPVHGGLEVTLNCLRSVLEDLPRWARVVVIDDASPDPAVARALSALAAPGKLVLLRQRVNRGFPATANRGLRYDRTRDVVLLNSDTLVAPGWLVRLRAAAYAAADIGSATPLSNDATLVSYPSVIEANAVPSLHETRAFDAAAARVNAGRVVEIPSAVGFCMYLRRDCIAATGELREDVFAQGYGEENDFCLRASAAGWRHVAAVSVFVAHLGGASFGAAKTRLFVRNVTRLYDMHPGYERALDRFEARDPLGAARRRIDGERWRAGRRNAGAVLLISHDLGGGVARHVGERAAALRAEGLRPIVIRPARLPSGETTCVLSDRIVGETPALRFAVPRQLPQLARFLRADAPLRAEVHHLIGHDRAVLELCDLLQIPRVFYVHDYAAFCSRITLIGEGKRYCGEPGVAGCEACFTAIGAAAGIDARPARLRARSAAEFAAAENVIVPSSDVAVRLNRYFPGLRTEVQPWADDARVPRPAPSLPAPDGLRRIAVVGGIGIDKGYEVLLACAEDAAARDLALTFRLVGHSSDDAPLLATGRVMITGSYEPWEAVSLIRAQGARLAFLPALWPETWTYTLSEAWEAGLDVAAFDIGAPAERIRNTGRGWLLPLGLPAGAINERLLRMAPAREADDAMTLAMRLAWREFGLGEAEDGSLSRRAFIARWLLNGRAALPGSWWYGPAQEAEAMRGGELPELLVQLHATRPDLAAQFDISARDGRAGLLRWYRLHGAQQLAAAPALPPAREAEIDAWFGREDRARPPAPLPPPIGNEKLPCPAIGPRRAPAGVNLIGHARAEFGIGEVLRSLSAALDSAGVAHAVIDVAPGPKTRCEDASLAERLVRRPRYPVSVICATGFETVKMFLRQGPLLFSAARNIGYWPWELPRFPDAWSDAYALVDEIWALSRFSAEAYGDAPKPVRVMPPAVRVPQVPQLSRRAVGLPERAFVFAFPFDPGSSLARKNPSALVRAFRRAFPGQRDVALLLRANGPLGDAPGAAELAAAIGGDPRILVREQTLDRVSALALLAACDALVSPHRAEGFGFNMAEAILLGLPVRGTGFSGNMDFLREEETVAWRRAAVEAGAFPHGEGQWWAEPDGDDLAAQLVALYRRRRRGSARRAAALAAEYGVAPAGARFAARLSEILAAL